MSRQILRPVRVWTNANGHPVRFTWRGVTYSGRVVNSWKLRDRWWDAELHSDRTYYRLVTRDHQAFDLYRDDAKDGLWILANIHD
jgi:Domain of unknown function (DUF6504)